MIARLAALAMTRFLLGRMAGGADDVDDAGGGGQFGEGERRGRNGEFDQAVGLLAAAARHR